MTQSTLVKNNVEFVQKSGEKLSLRIPGGAVLPYAVVYDDEGRNTVSGASARWSAVDFQYQLNRSRVKNLGVFRWDNASKRYVYDTASEAMYQQRHGNAGAYTEEELAAVESLKDSLSVFKKSAKKRLTKEEASAILEGIAEILDVPEIAQLKAAHHEQAKK